MSKRSNVIDEQYKGRVVLKGFQIVGRGGSGSDAFEGASFTLKVISEEQNDK